MTNSRDKGKRGEREARDRLNELFGWKCRRGQQYAGGPDSADLGDIPVDVHFEVKRVEKLNLHSAIQQAISDAGNNVPVVLHKRNRGEWIVSLRLDDLPRLVEEMRKRGDE